jgi:competence protein ComGC
MNSTSVKKMRGFTIVEMIVAFGIFMVIMVMSVGALMSLMEANHKARALKTVVNNLHFAFENISRNLRTGFLYHCDITEGTLTEARDCAQNPASSIIFTARNGKRMAYKYTPVTESYGAIERAVILPGQEGLLIDPATFVPITSPEIKIEQLNFYVDGASSSDQEQPRVFIVARGSMQGKSKVVSTFNLQTLVSQRLLDVEP